MTAIPFTIPACRREIEGRVQFGLRAWLERGRRVQTADTVMQRGGAARCTFLSPLCAATAPVMCGC